MSDDALKTYGKMRDWERGIVGFVSRAPTKEQKEQYEKILPIYLQYKELLKKINDEYQTDELLRGQAFGL